jgi:hypothetical protein
MSFIAEHPVLALSSALTAFFIARKIIAAQTSSIRRLSGPVSYYIFG